MQLNGEIQIHATREKVWESLNDPQILALCIPGCDALDVTSPTERTARVSVKIGPVRAKFSGHLRMEEIRPNVGCVLRFEGSGGVAGMAKGTSSIELRDEAGGTSLSYTAEAVVSGKLGQVGGRMIDAAAKQMADQFFSALNEQLVTPGMDAAEVTKNPAPPAGAMVSTAATSTAEIATDGEPGRAKSSTVRPPVRSDVAAPLSEAIRLVWFLMGSVTTGLSVWLGARLFG